MLSLLALAASSWTATWASTGGDLALDALRRRPGWSGSPTEEGDRLQPGAFSGNNVSVNFLKGALPLPKVHYSWAFPPGQFQSIDAADGLLIDYARVTGSIPLGAHADWSSGCCPPCGAAAGRTACAGRVLRTRMAVEACHRASLVPPPLGRGDRSRPSIALNFSPWYAKFKGGTNASSTIGEQEELDLWNASLAEVKGWIAQSNQALGATVKVGAVALDSEQFTYSPSTQTLQDKAAVRRKNELIYGLVRSHFPDPLDTVIIFYDYGASEYYPRSPKEDWLTVTSPGKVSAWNPQPPSDGKYHAPAGWVTGINHATYDESFAQEIPFSFSAYSVHQSELTRTKFIVTAESARAQHADGGTARVIPYISLGAGYRPNTTMSYTIHNVHDLFKGIGRPPQPVNFPNVVNVADFPFDTVCYDVGFDPDLSYASMLGGLINQGGETFNSSGYFSALGPWEFTTGAVFFPSVFETSCTGKTMDPGAGGCVANSSRLYGSTNLFDHFLSYIAGAHGDYTAAPARVLKTD